MSPQRPDLISVYLDAKEFLIRAGFAYELDWHASRSLHDFNESEFLSESAWAILSSGFREAVVSKVFPQISQAFDEWVGATAISRHLSECRLNALRIFSNERKISAICDVIARVARDGFPQVKDALNERGLEYLQELPQIGPTTAIHILKNLGAPIAKPDRHLVRIAAKSGYVSVHAMCLYIHEHTGDPVPEVDTVLWRYATIEPNYLTSFSGATHPS
jgi:hypothetical protein